MASPSIGFGDEDDVRPAAVGIVIAPSVDFRIHSRTAGIIPGSRPRQARDLPDEKMSFR
jgi:hypothetical protein